MPVAIRRATAIAIGLLLALAAYFAATHGGAEPANAETGTLVHVKQSTLNATCGGQQIIGAHFIINQITSPPSSIEVTLSTNDVINVPLSKQVQKVGHYTLNYADADIPPGTTVTDAVALVPAGWTGQFNLSNYICGPGGGGLSS
jgi:hypothetical protein